MAEFMPSANFIGKRVFTSLFSFFILLLLSACSNTTRAWEFSSNTGVNNDYCSSRLCLAPDNNFTGLHLEILNTSKGILGFVNLYGLALKEECKSEEGYSEISVRISTCESTETFKCILFKGGHRIRLRNEALDMIMEALQANNSVKIYVCHYSSEIIADKFPELKKNL